MKPKPPERFRITPDRARSLGLPDILATTAAMGMTGLFVVPGDECGRVQLKCIVHDGKDGGDGWEHVSVSLFFGNVARRCPDWEEMCRVKDVFWNKDECVVQYHPPEKDYVNRHPYVLHLWRNFKAWGDGAEAVNRPKNLLPCPFCGGHRVELMSDFKRVWVACRDCHSCGPAFDGDDRYATAEQAWNRRDQPCTFRGAVEQLLVACESEKATDDDRQEAFHRLSQRYCDCCGREQPAGGCQCENDE